MKTYLLATCFLTATITSASAGTIVLTNSSPNPYVGSTFTISLNVAGNLITDEIIGFGLNYSVNNGNILFQSFAINPLFGADLGLAPATLVAAVNFPGSTAPTVNLVDFTFLASSVGSSTFSVTSNPSVDLNQGLFVLGELNARTIAQQLQVDVQAVPEPSTFALVALAAGGMWMARRRA